MIRIKDNRKATNNIYSHLFPGQVFAFGSEIYMALIEVVDTDGTTYNAVCLNDGELTYFQAISPVYPLDNITLEIN